MDGGTTIFSSPGTGITKPEVKPVSLYISVCSGRGWHGNFGYSLAAMMMGLGVSIGDTRARVEFGHAAQDNIARINLAFARQANIVCSRQDHMVDAINQGYTHFLSLDDDMTFPALAATQLLAHRKPVVTINYRKKTNDKIECVCSDADGHFLDSVGKTGLERVRGFGMGVTLIDLDAIKHIPLPYFAVVWNAGSKTFMIEDTVFSNILWENGVEVYADHDLTQEVGHVGDFEFRLPQRGAA